MGRIFLPEAGPANVAQIVGNAQLGGVVSCLLNYYRYVDKSKYRFDFITYGPSQFDELL